jgi:hypothetical protein
LRAIHWVAKTKDKKTGEVVASYSPKETCPDSCELKKGGCYAWGLFYLNVLSNKIRDGKIRLVSLKEALTNKADDCKIVRHRVAGDIVGDVDETLKECELVESIGLTNIGYTHHWRSKEAEPLKGYFRASCETEEDVLKARDMGWGATMIVPKGAPKRMKLANGETAYLCPARRDVPNKPDITCNTCTLCKIGESTIAKTVMFEVHGNAATLKKANAVIGE